MATTARTRGSRPAACSASSAAHRRAAQPQHRVPTLGEGRRARPARRRGRRRRGRRRCRRGPAGRGRSPPSRPRPGRRRSRRGSPCGSTARARSGPPVRPAGASQVSAASRGPPGALQRDGLGQRAPGEDNQGDLVPSRALMMPLEQVLPPSAAVTAEGHLSIGGCDLVELAEEHGTPLVVYDEGALRGMARAYRQAFAALAPDVDVIYASKAYFGQAMLRLAREEGLCVDVASGGRAVRGPARRLRAGAHLHARKQQGRARGGRGARGRRRHDHHRQPRRGRPARARGRARGRASGC